MAQTIHEWMNKNELRAYPIADTGDRMDHTGSMLAENFLADCNIWYPKTAGDYAFISSAAVSPALVSITVSAADALVNPSVITPLCVLSLTKPIVPQKPNLVEAMYPGVGGWIAFGAAADHPETFSSVFRNPESTLLAQKAARAYDEFPVKSIAKLRQATALTGLVLFKAGRDVRVEAAIKTDAFDRRRDIDGEKRDCLVFALEGDAGSQDKFTEYAGPCGKRPDQASCGTRLLQTLNGVRPDCFGNVTLEFRGFDGIETGTITDEDGNVSGIQVDYPFGLVEVCEGKDKQYDLKSTTDLCENEIPADWEPSVPEEPEEPDPEPDPEPADPDPRYTTPWIELFDNGPGGFVEQSPAYWSWDDAQYAVDTRSGGGFNTSINTKTRTLGSRIDVAVWTGSTSDPHAPYILFDYESVTNYWYLYVDPIAGRLVLGQRTGAGFFPRASFGYVMVSDTWINVGINIEKIPTYRGRITISVNGTTVGSSYDTADQMNNGNLGFAAASSQGRFGAVAVYVPGDLPTEVLNRNYLRPTAVPTRAGPVQHDNNDLYYDFGEYLTWSNTDSVYQLDIFQGNLLRSYYPTAPQFEITSDLFVSDPSETNLPYAWRVRGLNGTEWSMWSGAPQIFRVIGGLSSGSSL
jgi:hypothetical protein